MSNTVKSLLALLPLLVLVGIGTEYLFRVDVDDNAALGIIRTRYHWGRPAVIEVDKDRDGRYDFSGIVDAPFGPWTSETIDLLEYWESRKDDGAWDVHVTLKNNTVTAAEIDTDGDGTLDLSLRGEMAASYLGVEAGSVWLY